MRKKLFVVGSAVLMCFNQFIYVSNATASPAVGDYFVDMESAGKQKFSSADLDRLYPVDADSLKWEKLVTEEDRFAKTQIASSIVEKMDTGTLLEATLRSPMLYTVENADDRKSGVMAFLEKTNTGQELLERRGAKDAIINEYLSLEIPEETLNDYSELDNCSSEDYNSTLMRLLADEEFSKNVNRDSAPYYRIHFLEGAILSDEIYPKLTVEQKKKLYDKSLILNAEKQKSEVFSHDAELSFTKALMADDALAEKIIFPKSAKKVTTSTVYLKTPNGTKVKAIKYSDNKVNSSAIVSQYQISNPEKKVVKPGWTRSNCHAYTWPGKSEVWLQDPGAYYTDGSYVKVSGGRPTANYQKVTDNLHQHSAIVTNCGSQRVRTKRNGNPIYECDLKVDFPSGYTIYKRVC